MLDKTTDILNSEQWRQTEDFYVHEEFAGLYKVPSIDAATHATDALCRLSVPLSKLLGECCNSASSVDGARSGVAK